jgi:hypothetical protein
MKEFNLVGKKLMDMDGKEIEDSDMAQIASNALVESNGEENIIKLYELAIAVKSGPMKVDTADYDLIEKTIRQSKSYTILAKAQVLLAIKGK